MGVSDGSGAARRGAFGAYEEPLKRQAAAKSRAFKVALVAADCLLLGERRAVGRLRMTHWAGGCKRGSGSRER